MSKSDNAPDNNVSIVFKLVLACIMILLCFLFFFFVALSNVLTTLIHAVNTNVNDALAIPTGIPTTVVLQHLHVKQYSNYQMRLIAL